MTLSYTRVLTQCRSTWTTFCGSRKQVCFCSVL